MHLKLYIGSKGSMRYEPIVQGKARMRKAPSSKIQTIVPGKYVMIYKPNAKNSLNVVGFISI